MKRINDPKENWIIEDNPEELAKYGAEDPFHLEMIKKKERVQKNKKSHVKNLKRTLSAQVLLYLLHWISPKMRQNDKSILWRQL